ncbi:response regulator phosphatase [Malaciobacter marinus]|uniref:Chemotaxis protein CheC n=1 Tax=Malaciobacter marinus TaxID=505249 RepID=A0A347TL76_9BACT|nr:MULTISPECIES: chemotaxis protein CheX [Malaciobacter]AXX87354.1 response regulator phosphatase [Malaciobacter marinus]PHO13618.1 chemotaxis protein CheC [Malaciobacter marinus]PHO15223.1 chemotaxis protein CheC [Malaciobacter marinus]RYA23997.1 chemotaxis protein CheC [Malaciobacter halophilus]
MSNEIILNEDEKDCLQELMNIAYGSATAAITEILDAFATLSIPRIEVIKTKNLKNHLSKEVNLNSTHFVCMQQINGPIAGENLFVIDNNSAKNIAIKFGLEEDEITEIELCDIILEITNILSSSTISKLAEDMKAMVSFSPPDVKILDNINKLDNQFIEKYQNVIIISTRLKFEDLDIDGQLMILTTDKSINYIKKTINKILNEI